MEKKKIILPSSRTITSDDIDIYLNVDIVQSFKEIKRHRFDNDFDLNARFNEERNSSRNFFIYGEVNSVAVDCDSIIIRVYSDPEMTQLYAATSTTPISYRSNNVFGKKNGKYFFEFENCPYEILYFKILSDSFYYRDQTWERRFVFFDADGNFVSYGSDTSDINYEGQEVIIQNDFPFFFNKHWIRNDITIIEEKKARITFENSYVETGEGVYGEIPILLDKESPFGLERAVIDNVTIGSTSNITFGDVQFVEFPVNIQLQNYGSFSIASSGRFFPSTNDPYNGKLCLFVQLNGQDESNLFRGNSFSIIGSEYSGIYEILYSSQVSLSQSSGDFYFVVLDTQFIDGFDNSSTAQFSSGSQPDIQFYFNNSVINFPLEITWQEGERNKSISFIVNEDRENEIQERVKLSISQIENLRRGQNMTCELRINDSTPRRYVDIDILSTYQNREEFTGRTYVNEFGEVSTTDSYSVLRNGLFYEGRNEEFYPTDEFKLRIKNLGQRTIFPINQSLSVFNESIFDPGEERSFNVKVKYDNQSINSVRITLPSTSISQDVTYSDGSNTLKYNINGVGITTNIRGYGGLKMRIDDGQNDYYSEYSISKPFNVQFNEVDNQIILIAKSPGTRIDFWTNDQSVTSETITSYQYPDQIPTRLKLLANINSNTTASYRIEFEKMGYAPIIIEDTMINNLVEDNTSLSMVMGLSNIMRPFIDGSEQVYTFSSSTMDDNSQYTLSDITESQPTYMPVGNAYVNGLIFLSNAITPRRHSNLTSISFVGFIEPLQPITNTSGGIVISDTKKTSILRIDSIPQSQGISFRQFEFNYGNDVNQIFYRFIILNNNAQYWWLNGIGMITTDINNGSVPPASLQQRLDIGTTPNEQGPISGSILNSNNLLLSSKSEGIEFEITTQSDTIKSIVLCENMLAGEENLGDNRMGGFVVNL